MPLYRLRISLSTAKTARRKTPVILQWRGENLLLYISSRWHSGLRRRCREAGPDPAACLDGKLNLYQRPLNPLYELSHTLPYASRITRASVPFVSSPLPRDHLRSPGPEGTLSQFLLVLANSILRSLVTSSIFPPPRDFSI